MAPLPPDSPLGLYLHVPFCSHVCPYCDFNTYAGQEALIPRYVAAMERDIAAQGALLGGRAAGTVFFGGGTPSLLPAEAIAGLVRTCRDAFAVATDAEVTLEANPNSVAEAYFAGLLAAGVNRLSIGVQTLHRRGLRVLGRQHEAEDARRALQAARAAGFGNISLDLIFGWPGQTLDDWRHDLETVLGWDQAPEHLSLYSLIVEPGTPMADAVARGILAVPDEDATADLYEAAIDLLERAGWVHYEVANFSRGTGGQGDRGTESSVVSRQSSDCCSESEPHVPVPLSPCPPVPLPAFASRHNAVYWRNGEYAGFGAGAHARIGERRTMGHLLPRRYVEAIEAGESVWSNEEVLAAETQMGETMMLGLRLLQEGVGEGEFAARHGIGLDKVYGEVIGEMVGLGLMERTGWSVRLTRRGLMVANEVCARFV
ncbi:MAG TPA: radical SAM family heme chaperone HemW [Thermomicrobiales bacterium]